MSMTVILAAAAVLSWTMPMFGWSNPRGAGLPPHVVDGIDRALAPFPVPSVGDSSAVSRILSNSFAFGGSNVSIVLGKVG